MIENEELVVTRYETLMKDQKELKQSSDMKIAKKYLKGCKKKRRKRKQKTIRI